MLYSRTYMLYLPRSLVFFLYTKCRTGPGLLGLSGHFFSSVLFRTAKSKNSECLLGFCPNVCFFSFVFFLDAPSLGTPVSWVLLGLIGSRPLWLSGSLFLSVSLSLSLSILSKSLSAVLYRPRYSPPCSAFPPPVYLMRVTSLVVQTSLRQPQHSIQSWRRKIPCPSRARPRETPD